MTAVNPRRSPVRLPSGQMLRRVTGTAEEVAATVALVRQSGRLLAVSVPRQLNPDDPRVTVIVRLLDHPVAREPRRRNPGRWIKPTLVVGTIAGALFGVGYLLMQLTQAVSRAVATPAVIGGAFVLLVVIALIRRLTGGGGCSGLHCSGCGRH